MLPILLRPGRDWGEWVATKIHQKREKWNAPMHGLKFGKHVKKNSRGFRDHFKWTRGISN